MLTVTATPSSPMYAHTYCLLPSNLMCISSILKYCNSEMRAFISSAVSCSLSDTAVSACFTAILYRSAPNVSVISVWRYLRLPPCHTYSSGMSTDWIPWALPDSWRFWDGDGITVRAYTRVTYMGHNRGPWYLRYVNYLLGSGA